jgi:phenylacetate-coenzyme A ligase PaaK-like adenylate-forming protein
MEEFASVEELRRYQLKRLDETLQLAFGHSRFYASRLANTEGVKHGRLKNLEDLQRLPFTDENDLKRGVEDFLCVPPEEIARMVSLFTSGSTGAPKRVGFTENDIETTVRYFASGMSQMTGPGKRTMICMPGKSEYGVAHLLSMGIGAFGGLPEVYGTVSDPEDAARFVAELRPRCVVGIPVQILSLSECYRRKYKENDRKNDIEVVLLSADYAAESLKARIAKNFRCKVLNHYGSTEMGYGGALECGHFGGLHVRALDLCFEIIDPKSGKAAAPGEEGEIVFTTLTRRGMPLIRYRTGDFARFLPGPCACGQVTPRFTRPWRKKGSLLGLDAQDEKNANTERTGRTVSMPELDEILFSDRRVLDWSASVSSCGTEGRRDGEFHEELLHVKCLHMKCLHMHLKIWSVPGEGLDTGAIEGRILGKVARTLPYPVKIDVTVAPEGEKSPGVLGKRVFHL